MANDFSSDDILVKPKLDSILPDDPGDVSIDNLPERTEAQVRPADMSDQQWLFVVLYTYYRNKHQAATEAGFSGKARPWDSRRVQRSLDIEIDHIAKRSRISVDRLINHNENMALADVSDIFEKDPETGMAVIKDLADIPDHLRLIVSEMKISPKGYIEIRLPDRLLALRTLMTYHGMLTDKIEHTISDTTFFEYLAEVLGQNRGKVINEATVMEIMQGVMELIKKQSRGSKKIP